MTSPLYLGIDVSKKKLHLGSSKKFLREFPNTIEGHEKLIKFVTKSKDVHLVMEASGGYESLACDDFQDAGLNVSVVQASCVRNYAKSLKVLAKTDPLDSKMIAKYAESANPSITPKTPENVRKIRALRDRREQLVADRVREQNRFEKCRDREVLADLEASILELKEKEKQLTKRIRQLIKNDQQMHRTYEILTSVLGVGEITAITLMGHFPELGKLSRQQIASLAGMAPHPQDSGDRKGKRRIYGGRAAVRRAMYMAARTAVMRCPVMIEFYTRLRNAGKPYKVAIIAVARKMLIRLNTLLKKENTQKKLLMECS